MVDEIIIYICLTIYHLTIYHLIISLNRLQSESTNMEGMEKSTKQDQKVRFDDHKMVDCETDISYV